LVTCLSWQLLKTTSILVERIQYLGN
jgi:hypothetical protein